MGAIEGLLARFLNGLYPEDVACFLCNVEAQVDALGICASCRKELQRPALPLPCPPGIAGVAAATLYQGHVEEAVHRLKYGRASYVAKRLAGLMEVPEPWRFDWIIPVPLWPKKQKKRGYNQSALIARALGQRLGLSQLVAEELLFRTRDTQTQTALPAKNRFENVQGAFCAASGVAGKDILLVDDVYTTGSTLRACAEALHMAGAGQVYACCSCVTQPPRGL